MNKKFSRIWGVGLTIALLASLMVVATPASAGTLSWATAETIPLATDMVIETSVINDYAVAADGKTIYAALTNNKLYKSTDSGVKWAALTSPSANTTDNISLVAIAPSNDNIVVVFGTLNWVPTVWISINAGSSFTSLGTPEDVVGTDMTAVSALAISPTVAGVTNIAVGGAIGANAAVCYFNYGYVITKWVNAAAGDLVNWTDNISGAPTAVRAIAFSPAFASDKIIGVVSENGSAVQFQIGSFATKKWNASVSGYTNYPVTVGVTGVTALTADLALVPSYFGADATTRIVFIGTMETGGANAPGGIYRLDDYTVTTMKKTVGIKSVAYNAAATKLVAGESGTNAVWRCANPLATTTTVTATGSTYKKPGVEGKSTGVILAWSGTNVFASTGGTDGGFSISKNDGMTFNDISLVNTAMTNIVDFSTNGTVSYLLTNDTADMSVWRYVTAWERVYRFTPTSLNYIVRLAPEDGNVVYLAETGTDTIWQSTDAGETKWTRRYSQSGTASVNIQDLAVESALVVYVAEQNTKNIIKSTDGGYLWSDTTISTKLAGGNNYMIRSVAKDQLMVGSTNGYISYSTDAGITWTAISVVTETTPTPTNIQVTADKLTTGGFIYAASGTALGNVVRWTIGTSTTWTDSINGTITGQSSGIGLSGGVLYVLSYDTTATSNTSYLYRELAPSTATSTTVYSSVSSASTFFNTAPQALKISTGPKLWAVNTYAATDTLLSLSDTVSTTAPTVTAPADLTRISVNPQTGFAQDVVYQWPRLSKATKYELQIAYDSAFAQVITTQTVTDDKDTVVVVLGPYTQGPSPAVFVQYQPNTTYYWRVRASAPLYSPYSTVRSLVTGAAVAFAITTPAVGATDVSVQPTFAWTEVAGVLNYEVMVCTAPDFLILEYAHSTISPFYKTTSEEALDYSTIYYWRVRGVYAPATATGASGASGPWLNGVITTEAEPVEPTPAVIVTPAPPAEIKIVQVPVEKVVPQAIPSYLLWAIICVGAVLIIALIVLIVRTRRVA